MFVFVLPLKSRKSSKSWERVSSRLDRTLGSLINQTSPKWRAIVVCHDTPVVTNIDPRIQFLKVTYPEPEPDDVAKMTDKATKVIMGMLAAKKHAPSYVMYLDADDLVSNRLVAYSEDNCGEPGWTVTNGYEYFEDSWRIMPRENLHTVCASCNIIRYDRLQLPSKDVPVSAYPEFYLGHRHVKSTFELPSLPFRGTVYVQSWTGEQQSQQLGLLEGIRHKPRKLMRPLKLYARQLFASKSLHSDLQQEFSISLSPSTRKEFWPSSLRSMTSN